MYSNLPWETRAAIDKKFHMREDHPWHQGTEKYIWRGIHVFFNDCLIACCGASELENAVDIYPRDHRGKVILQTHVENDEVLRVTIYGKVRIEIDNGT